tara:strand:- start:2258 stop:2818 length:561 start_codon:yes stop_codon:yes gene_type:complete
MPGALAMRSRAAGHGIATPRMRVAAISVVHARAEFDGRKGPGRRIRVADNTTDDTIGGIGLTAAASCGDCIGARALLASHGSAAPVPQRSPGRSRSDIMRQSKLCFTAAGARRATRCRITGGGERHHEHNRRLAQRPDFPSGTRPGAQPVLESRQHRRRVTAWQHGIASERRRIPDPNFGRDGRAG